MAERFFVRVQLHDAAESAYDTLHEAMEGHGFERTIKVGGELRKLPRGTYIAQAAETGGTAEAASERVSQAVKTTRCTSSFVIVETDTVLTVSNLEPAEQPKSALEELQELAERMARKRGA